MQKRNPLVVLGVVLLVGLSACGDPTLESGAGPAPTDAAQPTRTPRPTDAPEPSGQQDEPRFGYAEKERKTIYQEVVRAEDRAQNEAEYRYPTPDPSSEDYSTDAMDEALESQASYYREHAPRYRAEVAREFGLTMDELQEIIVEGSEKEWPLPPAPTPISD